MRLDSKGSEMRALFVGVLLMGCQAGPDTSWDASSPCSSPEVMSATGVSLESDSGLGFSVGDVRDRAAGQFAGTMSHWDGRDDVPVMFELDPNWHAQLLTYGTEEYPDCYSNYLVDTELSLTIGEGASEMSLSLPVEVTVSGAGNVFLSAFYVDVGQAGADWVAPGASDLVVQAAFGECWSGIWRWDGNESISGTVASFDGGC